MSDTASVLRMLKAQIDGLRQEEGWDGGAAWVASVVNHTLDKIQGIIDTELELLTLEHTQEDK